MLEIVEQIIEFYFKNLRAPKIDELDIKDNSFLEKSSSIFVTLYISGIIKGSSGNIKEIEENIVLELIENTIGALNDSRFEKIQLSEKDNLKIRIDEITERGKPLDDGGIVEIDPVKNGVLVIKTDYEKSATILPNISGTLMSGQDYAPVLSKKLDEDFNDKNYLVYKIETNILTNI